MKWSYISVLKSHKCANIKSYQCKVFCTGSYELYLNLNLQIVFKLLAKTSNHNLVYSCGALCDFIKHTWVWLAQFIEFIEVTNVKIILLCV